MEQPVPRPKSVHIRSPAKIAEESKGSLSEAERARESAHLVVLSCIKKSDITELKNLHNPSADVGKVIDAASLLLTGLKGREFLKVTNLLEEIKQFDIMIVKP